MTILRVEAQEVEARKIVPNVDTRARESLGNILRTSLIEGLENLLKVKSKISEDIVLAATAASMTRKQFKSEKLQHAIKLSLGSLTTKLHSTKQDVHKNIEHRTEGVPGKTILPEPTWVNYFSAVC